jgi:predicted GIY-YIG superfamily endonuclease
VSLLELRQILEVPAYCPPDTHGGVYIVVRRNRVVYVGESADIPLRLKTHDKPVHIADKIVVVRENDFDRRRKLERQYIKKYRPAWNQARLTDEAREEAARRVAAAISCGYLDATKLRWLLRIQVRTCEDVLSGRRNTMLPQWALAVLEYIPPVDTMLEDAI